MRKIKLPPLAQELQVEFADRDLALRLVEDWAEKGTYPRTSGLWSRGLWENRMA